MNGTNKESPSSPLFRSAPETYDDDAVSLFRLISPTKRPRRFSLPGAFCKPKGGILRRSPNARRATRRRTGNFTPVKPPLRQEAAASIFENCDTLIPKYPKPASIPAPAGRPGRRAPGSRFLVLSLGRRQKRQKAARRQSENPPRRAGPGPPDAPPAGYFFTENGKTFPKIDFVRQFAR